MPFLPGPDPVSDFPFLFSALSVFENTYIRMGVGNYENSNCQCLVLITQGVAFAFVSVESETKNLIEFETNNIQPTNLSLSFSDDRRGCEKICEIASAR